MANEFVARNGLIAQDNSQITGSVRITGNTSIGTSYNGFPLNVQGTAYIIGGSVWVNDGYGLVNASSTNTGIYPDSTHNITIKNNNNTTVYIKSDGNVGIGTTSPSRILHVVSPDTSVLFQSTTGTNSVNLQLNNSGGNFYVGSDNSTGTSFGTGTAYSGVVFVYGLNRPLVFGTDSTERMRITSTGNVGIGTTSPTVKLHVSGTTSGLFEVDGLNAINALYVSASGNVGIGTGSPVNRLHVYNSVTGSGAERTTAVDVLTLETENTTAVEYDGFGQIINFRGVTYNDGTKRNLGRIIHKIRDLSGGATFGTSLHFELLPNATASVPVERVVFDKNGNVGIGSSIPGATLDVAGDINFSGAVKYGGVNVIHNASTDVYINGRVIYSNSTYNDGMYIGYNSTGGTSAHIRFFANGTNERMRIDAASGNIGIATTSPTLAKLQVQGNVWAQSFTGSFSGSAAAPGANTQVIFNSSGSLAASSGFIFDGTNVGIGTTSPQSQFHIFKSTNLGGTAGDYLILKTLQNPGGAGGNNVYERTWAYRTGTGTDWTTWSIWNGISIDASYGTPTISRTWYWRDPYAGKQHFGDATVNVMTIGPSNVGIGTTSPAYKLEVSSSIAFSSTGLFSLQRITPNGSSGRQIVITSAGVNAGNISTANNIVCIGPFAGQALTGSGADSLIAIGNNAAGSITTGGSYSIFIGRGASNGITTGNNNIIINSSDSGGVPSNTSNALHLITAGGFEGNDGARALGGETSQYAFIGGGNSHPQYTRRFYFGGGPFVTTPQNANIDFYAPSATGSSDQQGANFTLNAGRGTGTGTPGDFIIATSSTGSSGVVNQTLSSRVWIKGNSGNVGIGSSTPAFKLDMPGIVQARLGNAEIGTTTFNSSYAFFGHETLDHSVANNYALLQDSLGGTYLNAAATKNIEFRISNTAVATILSGGNVGIGLTSPSAYLDVKGLADTAGVISLQLRSGNANSNFNSNQITLGYSNTAEYRHAIKTRHNSGASSGNSIDFYTWAYGGATTAIGGQHVMSLDGANVGIGTTSPGAKLDVIGNVRAQSFTGSFSGSSASPGANTNVIYNSSGVLAGSNNFIFDGTNVGIGTTAPKQKLDVVGAGSIIGITNTSATSYGELIFYEGSTIKADIFVNGSSQANYAGANSMNIWQGSNAPIAFYTNGTNERMRISANGSVGIGTSAPSMSLQIDSTGFSVRLRETSDGSSLVLSGNQIQARTSANAGSPLYLNYTNGGNILIAGSGTNVGIGTTSPSYKLHVSGGSEYIEGGFGNNTATAYTSANRLIFNNDYSDTARGPNKITLYDSTWLGGFGIHSATLAYYSGANHRWYQATTAINAAHLMTLDTNGNLGIGTTSPSQKLHIAASSNPYIRIDDTGVASEGGLIMQPTGYNPKGGLIINYSTGEFKLFAGESGNTYFQTFYTSASERMRITSNGNIGIGTTTPDRKLSVSGSIGAYAANNEGAVSITVGEGSTGPTSNLISLETNTTNNTTRIYNSGTSTSLYVGSTGTSSGVILSAVSNISLNVNNAGDVFAGTTALHISSSANVGIGTIIPSAKLQVSGSSNTVNVKGSGSALFSVDGTAGRLFQVDDSLSGSLFSVNTAAGLPVIEAFSDNTVRIGQFGQRALFVSQSRVGIGLENPTANLHVSGTTGGVFEVDGRLAVNALYVSASGGVGVGTTNVSGYTFFVNGGQFGTALKGGDLGVGSDIVRMFKSDNSVAMLVRGDGNVGIGSTSPGATLDVNGNVRAQSFTGSFSGSVAAAGSNTQVIYNSSGVLAGSNNFVFNGSNVGIGTSSTGAPLEVFSNSTLPIIRARYNASYYTDYDSNGIDFRGTSQNYDIKDNGSVAIRIATGRNVLIGTTTNYSRLTVSNGTSTRSGITISDTNTASIMMFAGASTDAVIAIDTNNLVFKTGATVGQDNGTERMRILSNGNVGIGSASPAYALDVNGTARVTTLIETSSKRYKKNIKKLSPSLPMISSLRPVTFNWKDKAKGEDTQYGLIAEEVLSIIPEAVSVNDKGEAEAISYTKLIPVLIKAVQELQTKVEKLEKQLSK